MKKINFLHALKFLVIIIIVGAFIYLMTIIPLALACVAAIIAFAGLLAYLVDSGD